MNIVRKYYSLVITDARPSITRETLTHQVGTWNTVLSILRQAERDRQLIYTHVTVARVLEDGTVIEHIWAGRGTIALSVLPITRQALDALRFRDWEEGLDTYNIPQYASLGEVKRELRQYLRTKENSL